MPTQLFEKFLIEYLKDQENPVGSDGRLPFRVLNNTIRHEELEGESIDIALQHLKSCSCPNTLSLAITREATDRVIGSDLNTLEKPDGADEKVYDAVGIAQLVFSSVHAICIEWKKDLPSFLKNSPTPPTSSDYGIKNTRRKMEDRHSVITNLNLLLGIKDCPLMQWYAVYDGHGGIDASNYASKQLYLKFTKQENFLSDPSEALKSSILQVDEDFCAKAKRERLRSGTTAVVALLSHDMLHVAWVGDSQAVLVRDGKPLTIMNPHKPEREDEKQRIEEMGGCVVWFGAWRVNGTLSVSRAIGDADHKPFVSGEADSASIPLKGNEDFLCLACDGFWDVFNGEDLIKLVREHMNETNDRKSLAEVLCSKAKSEGSTDNITILVIFLKEDLNLGKNESQKEATEMNDIPDGENPTVNGNNNNNNSKNINEPDPDESADTLKVLQGLQVGLEHKQKIPHKLLINYIKNSQHKKLDKGAVIVTQSSPHARLPHSLNNPKLGSFNISPPLRRRDTRGSLLSLSTIESITELPVSKSRKTSHKKNSTELPSIFVKSEEKNEIRRLSLSNLPSALEFSSKPLGYRAPNIHTRGRTRVPYQTSLVVTCKPKGNSRSPSLNRGYARSNPDDTICLSPEDNKKDTEIAITNSFSPSLKPRHQKKHSNKSRQTVKLVYRERRRSRSAF